MNNDVVYISGDSDRISSILNEYIETYLSLSYKNRRDWTFTVVYNKEHNKKTIYPSGVINIIENEKDWSGMYVTVDVHSDKKSNIIKRTLFGNSKISIFYGSQRGGLVCANGVCAEQPEFTNGIKLSYERLF